MTTTASHVLTTDFGPIEVTVTDRGQGHPVLVLHGGGGPMTVAAWADQLADAHRARVLTPTHPGFNGTPRPATLNTIQGLAELYIGLLAAIGLDDVTVVGNSIGGWITAEMALLASLRVSSYILIDAVGIDVPDHPVADFFNLTPAEIAQRSYHDPATYGIDPTKLPPEAQATMAANRETLRLYGGTSMTDPTLLSRLKSVNSPTLIVWGDADRIGDPTFGRAYAAAIPGAQFTLLQDSGHMPQIETPQALINVVWDFASSHAGNESSD
jgi:pimeloyl-ACP methyl ester carboxylesterase